MCQIFTPSLAQRAMNIQSVSPPSLAQIQSHEYSHSSTPSLAQTTKVRNQCCIKVHRMTLSIHSL